MSSEKPNPGKLDRGDLVGSCEILGRIGDGGFGYIFKVRRNGRVYALKIARHKQADLVPEDRGPTEERLHREVAALMTLHHPNIVRVHSFDRWPDIEEGYPYLVMDCVEGSSLSDWRDEAKPSLAQTCMLFEKIAGAVGHMHRLGICHRDLKSDNVMVRPDGEPIIVDFGLARPQMAYGVTRASAIGTITHLAPEYAAYCDSGAYQREPFEWKPTIDVYALGYELYCMLTGETPLTVASENGPLSEAEVLDRIKNEKPDPPSASNPAIPPSLDAIVLRLLEKDPARRVQTAEELAEILRRARGEGGRAWEVPLEAIEHGTGAAPAEAKPPAPSGHVPGAGDVFPRIGPGKSGGRVAEAGTEKAGARSAQEKKGVAASFREPTAARRASFAEEGAASPKAATRAPFSRVPTAVWELAVKAQTVARRRGPLSLLVGGGVVGLTLAVIMVLGARGSAPAHEPKVLLSAAAQPGALVPSAASMPPESTRPADAPAAPGVPSKPIEVPQADAASNGKQPQPAEAETKTERRPVRRRKTAAKPALERAPILFSRPISESPVLAQSVRLGGEKPAVAAAPKPLGVPLGAHIRARLLTNLDTRTIGSGPVEAELRVPLYVRGETVLPAHSRVYGTASEGNGRFNVRFTQLRLPDDTVVSFEGIAFSRDDGKPGLATDRRIEGPPPKSTGVAAKIARSTGNVLLDTITGGTAQDIARSAGQTALNHEEAAPAGSGMVLLLDAGVELDIFVVHGF